MSFRLSPRDVETIHRGVRMSAAQMFAAGAKGVLLPFGDLPELKSADELSRIDTPLDIADRPVINEFNGRHSVEVQLVDWRVSEVGS